MKKVLITLAILTVSASFAQEGQKRQPPKEAISACEGKTSGSSCSVETPRGDTVEGTCKNTPDKKYFACVPKNHKKKR
jgi:hypothetical protein